MVTSPSSSSSSFLVNKPDNADTPIIPDPTPRLANGPTRSIGLTKSAIYKGWNKDLDTAFDYQGIAQVFARQSEDHAEGRLAFSEKRKPEFKGQ